MSRTAAGRFLRVRVGRLPTKDPNKRGRQNLACFWRVQYKQLWGYLLLRKGRQGQRERERATGALGASGAWSGLLSLDKGGKIRGAPSEFPLFDFPRSELQFGLCAPTFHQHHPACHSPTNHIATCQESAGCTWWLPEAVSPLGQTCPQDKRGHIAHTQHRRPGSRCSWHQIINPPSNTRHHSLQKVVYCYHIELATVSSSSKQPTTPPATLCRPPNGPDRDSLA